MEDKKEECLCCSLHCAYNLDQTSDRMCTTPKSENQWAKPNKNQGTSSQNGNKSGSKDASGLSLEKDIFRQHLQVVGIELPDMQNFLRRNKIEIQQSPMPESNTNSTESGSKEGSQAEEDISKDKSTGEEENFKLIEGLPVSLRKFINRLAKTANISGCSVTWLRQVGGLLWARYRGLQEKVFQVYELLNYSQQILEGLELQCEDKYLGGRIAPEDKDYLTNFLQVYSATLLLVLNQYFQNPYYEQTAKEDRDDDSDPSGKGDSARSRKMFHQDSGGSGGEAGSR